MQCSEATLKDANDLLGMEGLVATKCEVIQTLWAGWGQICRIKAEELHDKEYYRAWGTRSFIMKRMILPPGLDKEDESYHRKLISYEVEAFFYFAYCRQILPVPTAEFFASGSSGEDGRGGTAYLMADLSGDFPLAGEKRAELSAKQVYAALDWLAGFHGFFWTDKPYLNGAGDRQSLRRPPLEEVKIKRNRMEMDDFDVWLNGGYTYLATRRKEYASLQVNPEWADLLCKPITRSGMSIAEVVAKFLAPTVATDPKSAIQDFETVIHGDVKSENLRSTADESKVVFFDFQYVGLGLGVCDLTKLFTCSVPLELLSTSEIGERLDMGEGERALLEYYRKTLEEKSGKQYPLDILELHWKTALVDWLRFQASWGFWGNTEWLIARGKQILEKDDDWRKWILDATGEQFC